MQDAPRYASLRDYLRVLRQHRIQILICVALFGGGALFLDSGKPETYKAQSSVELRDLSEDLSLQGKQYVPNLQPLVAATTTATRITDLGLAEKVRQRLGIRTDPRIVRDSVTAQAELKTGFVVVEAHARSAATATRLANAYAKVLVDDTTEQVRNRLRKAAHALSTQLRAITRSHGLPATAKALNQIQINDELKTLNSALSYAEPARIAAFAEVPSRPISPRPVRDAILGIILGLTLGIAIAFGRDSLDRRLRSSKEIREHLGYPVMGTISAASLGTAAISANGTRPIPAEDLESVRILRKNLTYLDVDAPPRSIVVTSALPEEGKSTVALNLALTSALAGRLTLLLECDLRRPSLAHRLGLRDAPGLTDYLAGEASPEQVLQLLPISGAPDSSGEKQEGAAAEEALVVLTAGRQVPRPAELLDSERMRALLRQLVSAYDMVIVDTAPVLPVVDTLALIPHVDALLLCARSAQTTRDQAAALRSALSHLPPKPTGVVVTGAKHEQDTYGYYAYAYSRSSPV